MIDIAYIRKKASLELGRRHLEDPEPDVTSEIMMHKAAAAEDTELLQIAARLPGDTLENYHTLGGQFMTKAAIGTPMFTMGQSAQPPQATPGAPTMAGAGIKPPGAPGALKGPATAGGGGGGIPQIKEPKIPGQNMGQGLNQGKTAAAKMRAAGKKRKESTISSTNISMMQQAFPPVAPQAQPVAQQVPPAVPGSQIQGKVK